MSIALTDGVTVVDLPTDLYWADETSWHPVAQNVERTLTGALVVSVQARTAGRPITLEPPVTELSAWMPRGAVEQLKVWADQPGLLLTLTLRGISHAVLWRHQDGEVMAARPVAHWDVLSVDDAYTATLKFMEI